MPDNENRSSVEQETAGGVLGIADDDWQRGVTLDRWAEHRDPQAFGAVKPNISLLAAYRAGETPDFDLVRRRPTSFEDVSRQLRAAQILTKCLRDDLEKGGFALGEPPRSATSSAKPVSHDALHDVIESIDWFVQPPMSSFRGEPVELRLYRPGHFVGGVSDAAGKPAPNDKKTTAVADLERDEAESSSGPSDNEEIDAKPPSLREQKKAKTRDKYRQWYDKAVAIKDDRTLGHPLEPHDIARRVASKFDGATTPNVKRRLNEIFPGWADYKKTGKK